MAEHLVGSQIEPLSHSPLKQKKKKKKKMLSMSSSVPPSLISHKPCIPPFKFSSSVSTTVHSLSSSGLKLQPARRVPTLPSAAATELAPPETEPSDSQLPDEPQKVVTDVKSVAKPRLVLKFIWMEKNIGLALDQVIPGHGSVPLSPYFFWPRKDAWEELKTTLESKPWISQKKMIILLNQATDIINLWQQSGGNLS